MRKFLYGVLGIMALGLASCSSDEPKGPQSDKVEADETQYLTVAICNPSSQMTRADFEDGATKESAVENLVFVFYDGAGNPTATLKNLTAADMAAMVTDGDAKWGEGNPEGSTMTEGNVDRFWQAVIPVEMTQGQSRPAYVVCFVNPVADVADLATKTLAEMDAAKRSAVMNGTGAFSMSNSVYYGNNPINGQSNVRMMATPVLNTQLYRTKAEALDETASVIDIYVERYAAKIGLNMAPDAIKEFPVMLASATGLTSTTIKFTPIYWRPNAIDEDTYVTKAFSSGVGEVNPNVAASYDALQAAFQNTGMANQGINGWNDATNHRSYWACSPSYYAQSYPNCSDNVLEATTPYEIKYFSFNELKADATAADAQSPIAWNATTGFAATTTTTGNTTTSTGFFYSRETTAAIEMLNGVQTKTDDDGNLSIETDGSGNPIYRTNFNNKAVPASVNIIGKYTVDGQEEQTFYLYGKAKDKDVLYTDEDLLKAEMIANQTDLFANADGTEYATNPAIFTIQHPSKTVRENYNNNVAGRLVALQLAAVPTDAVYIYLGVGADGANPKGYAAVTAENLTQANRRLWASASTAQKFYNGLAFFAIPIRHLGWGRGPGAGNLLVEGAGATEGRPSVINWKALRRGDLGVVRNHVYNYTVTSVEGLGVGLASEDQPMVPPMDPDNYYIAARLNILAWRVVPSYNIVL